jgi:hypothetical protein
LLADYDPSDLQSYRAVWASFRGLPEFSRKLLTSGELPIALKDLSVKFNFAQPTTMFVSVMVRKMIFREWDEEQSRAELVAWCQEFDPKNTSRSDEILAAVKKDILTITPQEEVVEEKGVTMRMTQSIVSVSATRTTGDYRTRVKLRASVEPVRGSLINWLKCYREELGVGYHDAMLRGQFLFRSQNGMKLTDEERGRIEVLLRSIEDREVVEIDAEHQSLLFPLYPGSKNQQATSKGVPYSPGRSPISAVAPVVGASGESATALSPGILQPKEASDQISGEAGANAYALGSSQFSSSQQTLGTLHFSSNHVLPVEKEIRSAGETPIISPDSRKAVPSVPGVVPRPLLAPKRSLNLSYIPKPFHIDPSKREQPEKDE